MNLALPEDFFTEEECRRLNVLFGTKTEAEFLNALQKLTCAALNEYKQMFLGVGLPSRADEIQQYRLLQLILYYFGDRLPTEAEVSALFQLTRSRSRNLIRAVMTRFHYQLELHVMETLRQSVKQAEHIGDPPEYRVVIQSDNVVEELNRIIGSVAPKLDPITRLPSAARTYRISEDTYAELCGHLNVPTE